MRWQLAAALELGGDRDQVGRLAAAVEVDDRVVDRLVRRAVEVDAAQHLGDVGDRVLGEQHRAEHATARRLCPAAGCGRPGATGRSPGCVGAGPSPQSLRVGGSRHVPGVVLGDAHRCLLDSVPTRPRWRSPDARVDHRQRPGSTPGGRPRRPVSVRAPVGVRTRDGTSRGPSSDSPSYPQALGITGGSPWTTRAHAVHRLWTTLWTTAAHLAANTAADLRKRVSTPVARKILATESSVHLSAISRSRRSLCRHEHSADSIPTGRPELPTGSPIGLRPNCHIRAT